MNVLEPGIVIWLTGPPASGKTTLADHVFEALRARGTAVLRLDSDDLRAVLTPRASYDDEERDRFYAALAHLAALAARGGVTVLVSATAPKREHRDRARRSVEKFLEIYLSCDLDTCRARDPKGLYARASRGEIHNLPGFDAAYEAPADPELVIDTGRAQIRDAAGAILRLYERASQQPPHMSIMPRIMP